ncbi:VTT domain-containing protein [Novosphingobium sp.]|uniref:TVP38/TMEM64 family protein n=1 Tax=Novosphingobium sp. TaxID=1874826 RepID=UPI002631D0FC|nr:VTT domain-containing protein [Novosphingobium sp.]
MLAVLLVAVILPWLIVGEAFEHWAQGVAIALSHRPWLLMALIAGLLALDPVLPVPSSIVAVAAGSALGTRIGALAIWIGLMAGVLFGCWLGRHAGRGLAARWLDPAALAGFDARLRPIGPLVLLVSRPIPVVAETVTILAGAGRLPLSLVLGTTAPANAALAFVWAGLGAASDGSNIAPAVVGGLIIPAIGLAVWPLVRRR